MMDYPDPPVTEARRRVLDAAPYAALDAEDRDRMVYNQVSLVMAAQIERLAEIDLEAVRDTLDFALHYLGAGSPDVALDDQMARVEAEHWARMATPSELVRYGEAVLRNAPDKSLHPGLLRRLLANLWKRLDPTDRRRFLDRVASEKTGRA